MANDRFTISCTLKRRPRCPICGEWLQPRASMVLHGTAVCGLCYATAAWYAQMLWRVIDVLGKDYAQTANGLTFWNPPENIADKYSPSVANVWAEKTTSDRAAQKRGNGSAPRPEPPKPTE